MNATLQDQSPVEFLLDPFQFGLEWFVPIVALKSASQLLMEYALEVSLTEVGVPKLPSRSPPIMKGLAYLEERDVAYLVINSFLETIYMIQLGHFMFTSTRLSYATEIESFDLRTILISIVLPVYILFYSQDFVYYFAHRFMHIPSIYPYVHKHHHRQPLPRRGYYDAANETPLEQIVGFLCLWAAFWFTMTIYDVLSAQVHVLAFGIYMSLFATLAFLNHTEFDIQFGIWGLNYNVRAHETHHRFFRCNYAQNTMIFDKIFGTFKDYNSGQKKN